MSGMSREGAIARVWRHAVLPLLEEHFFGTGIDIEARFGLPALLSALVAQTTNPDLEQP